jgi:transposase
MPLYQSHKLRQRAAPLPLRDRKKPHQLCTPEPMRTDVMVWQARSPTPRASAPEGYGHARFCELYEEWESRLSPTMRQVHPAGEWLFVDNAGQIVDLLIEQREVDLLGQSRSQHTPAPMSPLDVRTTETSAA